MPRPVLLVIAGPTASGKTALSIDLARHFNTSILSADSRQCYREMKIGVARPSDEELAAAPHYFVASHSIHQPITAAGYETYALNLLRELFNKHDVVICCGGTGLYLKALLEGLDEIPAIDPTIRKQLVEEYERKGMDWLQATAKNEDPQFAENGEMQNPHRILRALEVMRGTSQSILSFHRSREKPREFKSVKIALDPHREFLYKRINQRVDMMMAEGLLHEVKTLEKDQNLTPLQTVGYSELFDYLNHKISLEKAIEDIKTNTRRYAKRQLTWFRKQGYEMMDPQNPKLLTNIITLVDAAATE